MSGIELLRTKIATIEELQSVVKTMKALAAVNIRQYQQALQSLAEYNRTIEMGLQILLRKRYFSLERGMLIPNNHISGNHLGVIIFGSDQGLCGQFNQRIASYTVEEVRKLQPDTIKIAAVGRRLILPLQTLGNKITEQFSLPSSPGQITPMVQEMLLTMEKWQTPDFQLLLFYNQFLGGASYQPTNLRILPLDAHWLDSLEQKPWPSPVLPTFTMDENQLFSGLIQQYLFISLYIAFAQSLASENASRLFSMLAAQKNIEERLSELNIDYRRQRQSSITAELLDIVSGFEALSQSPIC